MRFCFCTVHSGVHISSARFKRAGGAHIELPADAHLERAEMRTIGTRRWFSSLARGLRAFRVRCERKFPACCKRRERAFRPPCASTPSFLLGDSHSRQGVVLSRILSVSDLRRLEVSAPRWFCFFNSDFVTFSLHLKFKKQKSDPVHTSSQMLPETAVTTKCMCRKKRNPGPEMCC